MTTSPEPDLCLTGVLEDPLHQDDVTGLRLSYAYNECFFTVLISKDFPSSLPDPSNKAISHPSGSCVIENLIARFNEACTWTEQDRLIEEFDKRLDAVWQEAEDLVRTAAFGKIKVQGRELGQEATGWEGSCRPQMSLVDYLLPRSFNLQIVPDDGGLNAVYRPDLPACLPFAAEHNISFRSDLRTIRPDDVVILERHRFNITKVLVEGNTFCCKLNITGAQNSFAREVEVLQRVRSSITCNEIRIPKLRGLVEFDSGVIGLLMDWIETDHPDLSAVLRRHSSITETLRQQWADEISHALAQLHELNLTWGDAKTANVLIDKQQHAWLVDFGGGFTKGWVDEALNNTQAGDLQGLENTLLDIFGTKR